MPGTASRRRLAAREAGWADVLAAMERILSGDRRSRRYRRLASFLGRAAGRRDLADEYPSFRAFRTMEPSPREVARFKGCLRGLTGWRDLDAERARLVWEAERRRLEPGGSGLAKALGWWASWSVRGLVSCGFSETKTWTSVLSALQTILLVYFGVGSEVVGRADVRGRWSELIVHAPFCWPPDFRVSPVFKGDAPHVLVEQALPGGGWRTILLAQADAGGFRSVAARLRRELREHRKAMKGRNRNG